MHEKVKEFLLAKREEELEKKKQEKAKILISCGLSEKVYYDHQIDDDCFTEFDSETNTRKYYKNVPIDVSDEEFALIKKYSDNPNKVSSSNTIATILQVIAVLVFVGGFISGIIAGDADLIYTIIVWASAFVSGTMFLGFAEIIKLLHDIRNMGE